MLSGIVIHYTRQIAYQNVKHVKYIHNIQHKIRLTPMLPTPRPLVFVLLRWHHLRQPLMSEQQQCRRFPPPRPLLGLHLEPACHPAAVGLRRRNLHHNLAWWWSGQTARSGRTRWARPGRNLRRSGWICWKQCHCGREIETQGLGSVTVAAAAGSKLQAG